MLLKEDIFRFKQFDIVQNQSVHRVGTDGVLLGAWVSVDGARKILDVGTGTGLIALMLAQQANGEVLVTALEPDLNAYQLASKNFERSKFSSSVEVLPIRVQDYKSDKLYDLIVCNPPFFNNSLKPLSENRTRHRHTVDLKFEELLKATITLLSPYGRLCMVLPVEEGNAFIYLATQFKLNVVRRCNVYSKMGKTLERILIELSPKVSDKSKATSLTIMSADGEWTEEYKSLTREFYLKF